MVSTFVYKCVEGRNLFAKTGSGPIETFTEHVVAWVIQLFVAQYLVMHCRQSILYRGPKIYNDVPMEIKLLNNPEWLNHSNTSSKFFVAAIYIIGLILDFILLVRLKL